MAWSTEPVGIAEAPAHVYPDVATLDPAELDEGVSQRADIGLLQTIDLESIEQESDFSQTLPLLSARRRRPSRRAAEKRDEIPPRHEGHGR